MKRTDTTNLTAEELRDLVRELEDALEDAEDRIADAEEERDSAIRDAEDTEDAIADWTDAAREAADAIEEFAREQIAEIPRTPDTLARLDWNRMTSRIAKAFDLLDSTSAGTIYGAASLY